MRFRKKPVVIEAVRFDGSLESARVLVEGDPRVVFVSPWRTGEPNHLRIQTLEGEMKAQPGDWIIKGVVGELYPCKPDIFEATYELVTDPT